MNTQLLSKLGELIEHSGEAAKLIIASEVALNDGELATSQKNTMKAIDMLKTMCNDVFIEILEEMEIEDDGQTSDLDPYALNLAYALSNVCYNAGVLLNMILEAEEERVVLISKTKLMHAISDAKSLFETLYM